MVASILLYIPAASYVPTSTSLVTGFGKCNSKEPRIE